MENTQIEAIRLPNEKPTERQFHALFYKTELSDPCKTCFGMHFFDKFDEDNGEYCVFYCSCLMPAKNETMTETKMLLKLLETKVNVQKEGGMNTIVCDGCGRSSHTQCAKKTYSKEEIEAIMKPKSDVPFFCTNMCKQIYDAAVGMGIITLSEKIASSDILWSGIKCTKLNCGDSTNPNHKLLCQNPTALIKDKDIDYIKKSLTTHICCHCKEQFHLHCHNYKMYNEEKKFKRSLFSSSVPQKAVVHCMRFRCLQTSILENENPFSIYCMFKKYKRTSFDNWTKKYWKSKDEKMNFALACNIEKIFVTVYGIDIKK